MFSRSASRRRLARSTCGRSERAPRARRPAAAVRTALDERRNRARRLRPFSSRLRVTRGAQVPPKRCGASVRKTARYSQRRGRWRRRVAARDPRAALRQLTRPPEEALHRPVRVTLRCKWMRVTRRSRVLRKREMHEPARASVKRRLKNPKSGQSGACD